MESVNSIGEKNIRLNDFIIIQRTKKKQLNEGVSPSYSGGFEIKQNLQTERQQRLYKEMSKVSQRLPNIKSP